MSNTIELRARAARLLCEEADANLAHVLLQVHKAHEPIIADKLSLAEVVKLAEEVAAALAYRAEVRAYAATLESNHE